MSNPQTTDIYDGCVFCGIKRDLAQTETCETDLSAHLLVKDGSTHHHAWVQIHEVKDWYGGGND